ncbi:MAG: LysR substrate-binding domain-containing protein [Cellulosilyticaceae bacterium]
MNLQYLHSFYVTVKANSISKAAKMLFLTQPGLSMQLQALEKELGANLLIRSNKGVELTKEGQVVFNYADKILALKDNIERDLDAVKSEREDLLISCCNSVGEYALPCTLYIYKKDHDLVDIDLQVCNTFEVVKNLTDLSSNIGIVQNLFQHPNLHFEPFYSSHIVLVGGDKHTPSHITLEELQQLPLILPTEGSGCRQDVMSTLSTHGINTDQLNIIFEASSLESIKSTVSAGKGYAFFPSFAIQKELAHQMLVPIAIENLHFSSHFSICYRNDHVLTPFEKDFINLLCSNHKGFC